MARVSGGWGRGTAAYKGWGCKVGPLAGQRPLPPGGFSLRTGVRRGQGGAFLKAVCSALV